METVSKTNVFFNKGSDKWMTPKSLFDKLNREFFFEDYDPCPIEWKEGDPDGLLQEWSTTTFVNPPFSKLDEWIKKAHQEWLKGKTIVLLMNAKTHIPSFHEYVLKNPVEIRFVKGKVNFEQEGRTKKSNNPWSTMVLIWRKEKAPGFIDLTFKIL
jgi:site-specific DNA-methyltransferase (adenine-specific)